MSNTLTALKGAKDTIGRLIAGIEQHHATGNCYDSDIWTLANGEYKALDTLRKAIAEIEYGKRRTNLNDLDYADSCYGADPS